ncbi:MAG: ATP-binding cassette domain-containing protein [Opitutales bacterium]|nr:ATP-binding cassette domain-containing protein [Opitutales bacterium]
MQIVVKNLNYVYSEGSKALSVRALDGVSLTVNEGEFYGIIGQTGSGKSTFVQHLNESLHLEGRWGRLPA